MLSTEPSAPVAAGLSDDHAGWPWKAEHYRLRSLLDMLLRWAHAFSVLQASLIDSEHSLGKLDAGVAVPRVDQFYIRSVLNDGYDACHKLSLTMSELRVERLRYSLDPFAQDKGTLPVPTVGDIRAKLRELHDAIHDELRTRLFLPVSAEKAAMYDQVELFGSEVHTKFSKASFDIREAGTCLALERATASVFHLMCVLEVGLDSLASALGLPSSRKNWEQILHGMEDAISKVTDRSDREFYSRAALEFKFFRDAWRNHTMHGRARYNSEQAEEVLKHVKAFMIHLATRLQERP